MALPGALRFSHPRRCLGPIALAITTLIAGGCGGAAPRADAPVVRSGFTRISTNERFVCRAAAFSPDGKILAAGGRPHWVTVESAQLWDAEEAHLLHAYAGLGCQP